MEKKNFVSAPCIIEIKIWHQQNTNTSTLDIFTPVAGRLDVVQHEDKTCSVSIICNNAGALFVHAIAEQTSVGDIVESIYVPRVVHSFFPINEAKHYDGMSKPLLVVQVTEVVDGIFISCTMSHIVADGVSFWLRQQRLRLGKAGGGEDLDKKLSNWPIFWDGLVL